MEHIADYRFEYDPETGDWRITGLNTGQVTTFKSQREMFLWLARELVLV